MATKVIGSAAPRETPDSRRREVADRAACTFRYSGLYTALEARLPAKKGAKWEGGWKVVSATLERGRGGMGVLTVACSKGGASGSGDGGGGSQTNQRVEIEMAQAEVDVRSLCDSGYTADLARWEAGDADLKARYRYVNANGGEEELRDNGNSCAEDGPLGALTVAKLILAGHESVLRFHPVATRTTTYDGRPSENVGAELGRVGGAPIGAPAGWEYLKTGDHLTEDSNSDWTRVEQWTGARKWSRALYKGGTGTP